MFSFENWKTSASPSGTPRCSQTALASAGLALPLNMASLGPTSSEYLWRREERDRVLASEAEAVRERGPDRLAAGHVRHDVDVTGRVGALLVDGRRHDAVADRQRGRDRGHRPGRAEQVPDHRLRGADQHP